MAIRLHGSVKHDIENLHPVDQYILVKLPKIEDKTAGGIILTENVVDQEQSGTSVGEVIKLGDSAIIQYGNKVVEIGDTVMFQRYAGNMFNGIDNQVYRLMLSQEVTSVFPKNK
jgi:co-chaperonin GroES (HSP10)